DNVQCIVDLVGLKQTLVLAVHDQVVEFSRLAFEGNRLNLLERRTLGGRAIGQKEKGYQQENNAEFATAFFQLPTHQDSPHCAHDFSEAQTAGRGTTAGGCWSGT